MRATALIEQYYDFLTGQNHIRTMKWKTMVNLRNGQLLLLLHRDLQ